MDAEATSRFAQLVSGPDDELRLDEACLLISAHAQPDLDMEETLAVLDDMAAGVTSFESWRARLFGELGLVGDAESYHAVENSLLDRVVAKRSGMPITLAVVGMEVGRRAGVELAGIGMPGHFLLRHVGEPEHFVDAFAGGQVLDEAGCEELFRKISDPSIPFRPEYLRPVSARQIVARILANLRYSYVAAGNRGDLAWLLRLQLLMPDTATPDRARLN